MRGRQMPLVFATLLADAEATPTAPRHRRRPGVRQTLYTLTTAAVQ